MTIRNATLCGLATAVLGCTATGPAIDLPLISPPVRAATPPALQVAARRTAAYDAVLHASELRERFFSGSGPTDLMTLLAQIDDRLAGVNAAGFHPACADQAPVPYTITPAGHDVELVVQCYQQFDDPHASVAFMQFGERDGKISLYVAVGAERLAAIVAPIAGSTDHVVDAWFGVGYTNATGCGSTGTFDDCSYALTELHADPASHSFEMAVAGIGVGFCGVQFASDGTVLRGDGSSDMGTTCNAPASLCVSASDLDTAATCGSADYLLPAIGRRAGAGAHEFGASRYPAVPNLTLDGTSHDALYFGPVAPTLGAGSVDAK